MKSSYLTVLLFALSADRIARAKTLNGVDLIDEDIVSLSLTQQDVFDVK